MISTNKRIILQMFALYCNKLPLECFLLSSNTYSLNYFSYQVPTCDRFDSVVMILQEGTRSYMLLFPIHFQIYMTSMMI
jgi:hypothetical protein